MVAEAETPEPRTRAEHTHSLVKALQAVPSLSECDPGTLLCVVGDSVNLVWPAGRRVFEPGTPSEGLFIVLTGSVRILGDDGADIAVLGPGEYFGELSLLLGTAHRRAVETAEDTELMFVPKQRFDTLLESSPDLAASIRERAEERLEANRGLAPTD
jgi:CRP-like cAMP-binding protein